jgi:protein O-mannosyl-transferase
MGRGKVSTLDPAGVKSHCSLSSLFPTMPSATTPKIHPTGGDPSAGRMQGGAWVLIFCLVAAAYWPALHGGFLWDDDGHICPEGLRSLHGLWRIWTDLGSTQQYYPVLHSAFWLEYKIWGPAVAGYHWVNVLLHAGSACLVVAIARRLYLPGALLAGLIFALHPVGVESVAWISEQKNTLSTIFCLGSALAYLRFTEDRKTTSYRLAFGLFIFALLTKTVTATLPVALLSITWWQRGHLTWKRDVEPLLPWIVLGGCFGAFTAWIERWVVGAQGLAYSLTLNERILLAGRAVWFYLGKLFWPAELTFIYPRWTIDGGIGWQYLFPAALLATGCMLWAVRRRNRGLFAALLIYVVTLSPVLGFLAVYPFIFSYVADHFQYLASIGVIIPTAAALASVIHRFPGNLGNRGLIAVSVVAVAGLGTLTWRQAHLYQDAETLYTATLERNPDCWLAHNNLARILAPNPTRLPEAIEHFEAALRINPEQADAHFNLANALAGFPENRPAAIFHYEASLRINPDQADAHNNYGILLATDRARLGDAIGHFQRAVELAPAFSAAHSNLGTAWSHLPGHQADAIAQYQIALRLNPESAGPHFDLANAFARDPERRSEAIATYQAALRIEPNFADAHYNLANLLRTIPSQRAEAIDHYREALRLRPGWESVQRILNSENAGAH